jgi:predicted nucleic acid-binding protein
MEPAVRGLVLDSSVLVAAERAELTTPEVVRNIRAAVPIRDDVPIVISALSVAELAHGFYRANTPERSQRRRQFVDELKTHIPVHPITEVTAEIMARVGGEQAAKGVNLPLADLIIGACALELGYAIGTGNRRDFDRIPDLKVISL